MTRNSEEILNALINGISSMNEVQSIGISGGKMPLPQAGKGDIDIFIYCDRIPEPVKRQTLLDNMSNELNDSKISVFTGANWGTGDFATINGIETWMMYFTTEETLVNIEAILNGEFPDKLGNYYYPVGRCAMLKGIDIQFDRNGFLGSLKERLGKYPDMLADTLIQYHLSKLEDTEDLERAASRNDLLFYHFAIDIALDHFLQALFAMNRTFFPSRKRTFSYIRNFKIAPGRCEERILQVVKSGGTPESIRQSYTLWTELVDELKVLK